MTRHQAWMSLALGGALMGILGAHAVNLRGLAYKITTNGRQPGEKHYRASVLFLRITSGFMAIIGTLLFIQSLTVLL